MTEASLITSEEQGAEDVQETVEAPVEQDTVSADTAPDNETEQPQEEVDADLIFGKYKDIETAQEAFKTLESENGRLRREKSPEAPEEYTYDFGADDELYKIIPEDYNFSDDPLVQHMEPVFKEANFTQDQVEAATKAWLKYQVESGPVPEEEMAALGEDASKMVNKAKSLVDGLSAEARSEIEGFASTASAVKALAELMDKYNGVEKELSATKRVPSGEAAKVPAKSSVELYAEAQKIRQDAGDNFQFNSTAQALYEKKMDSAIAAEEKGY